MDFPSQAELLLRLLLAAALGGAVGLERELAGHGAGLRTHMSVALGAALFGVVSAYGFQAFEAARADTNFQVDVTRVASQIVVGVGFLGGGTILKEGANVRGLTTAASLWVTAAVGTAAALGSVVLALVATGILLGALFVLRLPRAWVRRHLSQRRDRVVVNLEDRGDPAGVVAAIYELAGDAVRDLSVRKGEGAVEVEVYVVGDRRSSASALAPLVQRDDVRSVDVG